MNSKWLINYFTLPYAGNPAESIPHRF